MCGRYAQSAQIRDLMEQFEVTGVTPREALPQNWNIAPTNEIYIIRSSGFNGGDAFSRDLTTLSWGLIAPWLKEMSEARISQSRAINARSESIHEKPTFRDAFRRTRCLIPAEGYYEWATALGAYSPKQPFFITSDNSRQLSIAGIWSAWQSPEGNIIESASVITREAVGELATIHSRMPVMMPRERWDAWLNPSERDIPTLQNLMQLDQPAAHLVAHPVSGAVNSVSNNGKDLTRAITLGEPETLF
jgi:putative SOS response-associated peptidase YedK